MTAVLAELTSTGGCRIWNAGHPPPLFVRDGSCVELDGAPPAPPLSLDPGAGAAVPVEVDLQPGDVVLMFTDGLTEAWRPDDRSFFPLAAVAEKTLDPDRLAESVVALRDAATRWAGGAIDDDEESSAWDLTSRCARGPPSTARGWAR